MIRSLAKDVFNKLKVWGAIAIISGLSFKYVPQLWDAMFGASKEEKHQRALAAKIAELKLVQEAKAALTRKTTA